MTTYDNKAFAQAAHRFFATPKELTEADIAQLALVEPTLDAAARARQAGYVKKADDLDEHELKAMKGHVTGAFFAEWVEDYFSVLLASYRYRLNQADARAGGLEARVKSLEAALIELTADRAVAEFTP